MNSCLGAVRRRNRRLRYDRRRGRRRSCSTSCSVLFHRYQHEQSNWQEDDAQADLHEICRKVSFQQDHGELPDDEKKYDTGPNVSCMTIAETLREVPHAIITELHCCCAKQRSSFASTELHPKGEHF